MILWMRFSMKGSLTPNELDLLQRVDSNEQLWPLFFRKVKGLKWFFPLNEKGYFRPENNPSPAPAEEEGYVTVPVWSAIEYLVKTAPELSKNTNFDYAGETLQILIDATVFAKKNGFSNYHTWGQFSQIIKYIPESIITTTHLEIINFWLDDRYERGLVAQEIGENWLPCLLSIESENAKNLSRKLLETLYTVTFSTKKTGFKNKEALLKFDFNYAQKITRKVSKKSGQKLGFDAVSVFDSQLKRVLEQLENDKWSCIWHSAIEDHDQNKYQQDAENILIEAYRDSLDAWINNNSEQGIDYINQILSSEFETIQRLAIYTLSNHLHLSPKMTDRLIEPKYLKPNFQHEMWHFLNKNYNHFSPEQKTKTLKLISEIHSEDDQGNYHEAASAYSQAGWLAAIMNHGATETDLYKKNIELAKSKPEHPDFASYTATGWIGHESPIPLEELQSLDLDSLVVELSQYHDTKRSFDEPNLEGLVKTFKQLIKTDPLRFYLNLDKFLHLDLAYAYEIIEAYRDLWGEKAQLPWDDIWPSILNFCINLVSQDRFWSEGSKKEREAFVGNNNWIVSSIGRLIEVGTKSDEHAFSEAYLSDAEKLLLRLLANQNGAVFNIDSDAVSISINSPRGHCIEALINLALRTCRIEHKKNNTHSHVWSKYEGFFNSELDRSDGEKPEYEFVTLVTNYLPNFLYMSKDWVLSNLPRIFDQVHHQKWLCAMQGYAYVGTVYQEIYKYLEKNGDFLKALDDENIKERIQEKVIQNISIAYINDFDKLGNQDSLIYSLLGRNKTDELNHLIWFLWTLRNQENEKLSSKVFELWPKILHDIDLSTRDGKKLASQLCHWAVFIKELDQNQLELLLTVAPYAGISHNSYDLLKNIATLSKRYPYEACEVWMKMLETSAADYPEEAIRELFTNLLSKGAEGFRKARAAESEYIKKGNDRPSQWLREIRQKDEVIND